MTEVHGLVALARLIVPHFADSCAIDVSGEDGVPRRLVEEGPYVEGAKLTVPLRGRTRMLGTLMLARAEARRKFSEEEVEQLEQLAALIAPALDRRLSADDEARVVRHSMLRVEIASAL